MEIAKDTVVTLHYKLSDAQGNQIEESQAPMVYLHGGYHNTLPKIEEALNGKSAGYQVTIQVEPVDAFGEYDATLVKIEPREALPEPLEIGMQFEGSPDGDEHAEDRVFTVTDIADGKVGITGLGITGATTVVPLESGTTRDQAVECAAGQVRP